MHIPEQGIDTNVEARLNELVADLNAGVTEAIVLPSGVGIELYEVLNNENS